jgi:plasmid maintenance system antidote protein VapI
MAGGPYPNFLGHFMRAAGVNDPQLAAMLGVSKQQIFNLRHGHRQLTVIWAKRIAPRLGIAWERLLAGPIDAADQERRDLLAAYDSMSEERRKALMVIARSMAGENGDSPPNSDDPPQQRRLMRVVGRRGC